MKRSNRKPTVRGWPTRERLCPRGEGRAPGAGRACLRRAADVPCRRLPACRDPARSTVASDAPAWVPGATGRPGPVRERAAHPGLLDRAGPAVTRDPVWRSTFRSGGRACPSRSPRPAPEPARGHLSAERRACGTAAFGPGSVPDQLGSLLGPSRLAPTTRNPVQGDPSIDHARLAAPVRCGLGAGRRSAREVRARARGGRPLRAPSDRRGRVRGQAPLRQLPSLDRGRTDVGG